MTLANQPGAGNLEDTMTRLTGILSEPSTPTEPEPEATQEPTQEASEPETQEAKPIESKAESETEAPSRRRKLKLGEQDIEIDILTEDVDLDLIPKGLMMENDYRKKTMSVAEERKAFESQKAEFDAKVSELTDIVMAGAADLESDEMKELKELDPTEYWQRFEKVKSQADKVAAYKEKRDQELQQQYQALVEQETQKYTQVIPEWLDDAARQKDIALMGNFLKTTGFTDQEINSIVDSRQLSTIRKAALYDEITKKADISSKRVKEVPKSTKPTATDSKTEKTKSQRSAARLKETGRLDDATAAIKDILFN